VTVSGPGKLRNRAEFAEFLADLEILGSGIVSVAGWCAGTEPEPRPTFDEVAVWGGVARRG
jgi:hypothetical protein